jgi:site-specific DNA recombinase
MKTCVYARKSTLKVGQKETIDNQIKICRRRADELELDIVDIKTDSATGTDDNNRPEVKELIRDAVKGKYECVIMKGISRLYRKTSKGLELIERLDQNGIRVITVEEHFDSKSSENRTGTGKLDLSRLTMYLMFAEMESKKLADRIKYTQIEKAHAGEWNQASSVPNGYKYNQETKKLEVDSSKAEIIKLIFKQYVNGMGMKAIAHYLNGDNEDKIKYPSPKGKRWSEYTIGFILKNRVYCGDIVYNRRSKTERPYKQPENIGKSEDDIYIGSDYNSEEKWIITEDSHEAIIDRNTFQQAQEIMNTKAKRKGIKNNISLLASIGKCQKCGSGLTFKRGRKNSLGHVVTKDNYYCMNYIRYGKQFCTSHHVGANDLEELVINELIDEVSKRLKSNKVKSNLPSQKKTGSIDGDITKVEKNISTLVHKMDVLLEKNIEGKVTDTQYSMFNEKYSSELDLLTKQLEKLKIRQSENSDKDTQKDKIETLYNKVINIKNYPIEQQRYILLDLINKVEVNEGDVSIEFNF